jgi:hypothetical protein
MNLMKMMGFSMNGQKGSVELVNCNLESVSGISKCIIPVL